MKRSAVIKGLRIALVAGLLLAGTAHGAGVLTIDRIGTLPRQELDDRIFSYQEGFASLQRSLERLNKELDTTSQERIASSERQVRNGELALQKARKALANLTEFVASNRRFLMGEQARYLPLADLGREIEDPYLARLADYLAASRQLLAHTGTYFAQVSAGQEPHWGRYEDLYRAYLDRLDQLNDALDKRAQALRKFVASHPDLRDQLPP
ncbi:MAG TPA: hypothetical protein VIU41_04635 [Geobacteraceae bacterium]